ncbi:hypothetical protein LMG19089_02917 [Ralstonia edaphis]|uniref:hypothetical protein n=1 Tax=Ralstonia edaphi TaxID=3058599 RepID=UPI0028F66D66|nr:hypothetical protein [Ralstonia sp. LMG 6871]CAJ0701748.1 hypothetical protein LMG19089_02917 [Ralstonia sp. LMG 6871]
MNSSDTRWVQGAIVLLLEGPVDQKEIVRQTDYVLLQMMGRIAHKCALLPVVPKTLPTQTAHWPNYKKGWPFNR